MFPTTVWTTIRQAGEKDAEALGRFAESYRPAILDFIRRRGFDRTEADDVCQEVFLRLLSREVLAKADPEKGRLRSLLLTVASRTIADHVRKRSRDRHTQSLQNDPTQRDPDFDRAWTLHLAQKAINQMEQDGSPYHEILREHLAGRPQDRKKLWRARRKLIAHMRREIAMTCGSYEDFQEETAYLSAYLRPEKAEKR